jgi:hypothetical protein
VLIVVLAVGLLASVLGGSLIRGLEKIGHFGILALPFVGYGIGSVIRATAGQPHFLFGLVAVGCAFSAAMLTHVPSAYQVFRREFGGPPLRSLLLSLTTSLNYPIEVSRHLPFYGVMLLLSLAAAGWRAAS